MSCSVQTFDLCIKRGDTYKATFTYVASDGIPVDLTGYTAKMQIRQKANSPDPAPVEITDQDGIVLGDAEGTVEITLSSENTGTNLESLKSGVYDLELTSPAGVVTTIVGGKVEFVDQVTR